MVKTNSKSFPANSCRALLVAMIVGVSANAHAADAQTVAKIASYAASDRQAFLEAGARAEGELLVYAVGSQIDPLIKAFAAKYPFLSVKVFKGDIPALLKKVTEEYRANVFNVDAYELDDYGLANRYPLGYWAKLFPFPPVMKALLIKLLTRTGIGAIPLAIPAGNIAVIGYKN